MTTLVAINTRDAIIMGSDSFGTVTKQLIDPGDLVEYFETSNGLKIKLGTNSTPLLDNWSKIMNKSRSVPSYHQTHIDKIFSLSPLPMGVMCSGVGALGDRSLKSLIMEFSSTNEVSDLLKTDYTLFRAGELLLNFLWERYKKVYTDPQSRSDLELMLCGYDKQQYTSGMVRIHVQDQRVFEPDYDFCVFFGGITREIQRLVFGTDMFNKMRLIDRSKEVLNRYYDLLVKDLELQEIHTSLKKPEDFNDELNLFNNWRLEGLAADWGTFSEQTAIESVDFLINIMIRSQEYSTQIPSVGGEVQIALVKKNSGFKFISPRAWRHGDFTVPIVD
jgi:hypothetical protein